MSYPTQFSISDNFICLYYSFGSTENFNDSDHENDKIDNVLIELTQLTRLVMQGFNEKNEEKSLYQKVVEAEDIYR